MSSWNEWVEDSLSKLEKKQLVRSLRPIIHLPINNAQFKEDESCDELKVFDGLRQWDRASVRVDISEATFLKWVRDIPSSGDDLDFDARETHNEATACPWQLKKPLLFSGNDYLGLSSHPTVGKAAANAAQELGMGPRGSALICGYTRYHRVLESCLADLKKKENCLLCSTGFSANMAVMTAIGYVGSISAIETPLEDGRIAIFSDALNHASIIDGICLAERQGSVQIFVYRHCDMYHLDGLLSNCKIKKKVVVSDSLFSMDGDFAPMIELAKLQKKHKFLLVIDDAHGTLVCGKYGGVVAEKFNCENDVDICVGVRLQVAMVVSQRVEATHTIKGRAFIFSTSTPLPMAAAAHAAVIVAKKETWRRRAIWNRVQDFRNLTGIPITSHIISLIVGSEEKALQASRHLLRCGFHITAIRPPTVPPNLCRLRITLSAAHTRDDLVKLTSALSQCINLRDSGYYYANGNTKL